jgi:hypothetical protein
MEDRYLFKAKHFKEWHIGNIVKEPDGLYIRDIKGNVMAYIDDESTICQCTTMPDKNKKLVFEHDIVWDSDERAFYEIIWNQEDMCWNVEDADGHKSEFEECYGSTIEVNGNRFDNPDLLGINTQNDLERHWLEKYAEENDRD